MPQQQPQSIPPTYEELAANLKRAEERILELERMLMGYLAKDRSHVAARREIQQGQPLLDLVEGHEPPPAPVEESEDADDVPVEPYAPKRKTGQRRGRRKLPAHLPREIKEYGVQPGDLPDYDPQHGYKVIDHDTCEELVVPRVEPKVIVHQRPVVLYQTREGEARVATVGGVSKVFPKCMASPEVLSQIAVDRLHYHLTLYRIQRWFVEHGCALARSTICDWMIGLGKLLKPLATAQELELALAFCRHADDTVMHVLAPKACDEVRVWVILGDLPGGGREIIFTYTESRTADAVASILAHHAGYLHVDACGSYDRLFEVAKLTELGCWSHVQRKFEDVVEIDRRAKPMLRLIRRLYAVDSWGESLSPPERKIFRNLAVRPILTQIWNWVKDQRQRELVGSNFKKALNYVANQWAALNRFLEDGRLRLDNNVAEAEFHVLGIGRRNHLFWGSREGLESGLVLYGLIRSCVANGIDPYQYLVDVIRRVTTTELPAKMLIPSRWKALAPLTSQPTTADTATA